ncbi:MAG: hypothetical protein IJ802_04415, partial [Kiritimatiellae bacterium]|nr:hypothetical protein [Kiritimatiellia bacterium]
MKMPSMKISLPSLLLSAIFIAAVFYLNTTFSFASDDCMYGLQSAAASDGIPPHLGTLANAFAENWRDGYRPVVHIAARIFTGCFDKGVFNAANTIMACLFALC